MEAGGRGYYFYLKLSPILVTCPSTFRVVSTPREKEMDGKPSGVKVQ